MNNILDALEWRYAVKKFDDKASLTEQQILEVKKVFNLSASSYGLQPYKMIVVQNPELKEKLVPASFGQQQISQSQQYLFLLLEQILAWIILTNFLRICLQKDRYHWKI